MSYDAQATVFYGFPLPSGHRVPTDEDGFADWCAGLGVTGISITGYGPDYSYGDYIYSDEEMTTEVMPLGDTHRTPRFEELHTVARAAGIDVVIGWYVAANYV